MDLITVLTCPIKRSRYLLDTLAQLDEQGARGMKRIVLCDGPMTLTCPWEVIEKPTLPTGTRQAHWWAFRTALSLGADRVLYCEDDLVVGKNAITKALLCEIPPDMAFVNFHDRREFPIDHPHGLHAVPMMGRRRPHWGLTGLQCILFPRRTLEYLTQKEPREWGYWKPEELFPNNGDHLVSWALKNSPWPQYLMHIPSLIDHAGDVSSLRNKKVRRAINYQG